MKTAPTNRKRTCPYRVTESRDVDSHVSETPQVEWRHRDQVTPRQLNTITPPLDAF